MPILKQLLTTPQLGKALPKGDCKEAAFNFNSLLIL
jgi:hypothetical protein